MSPSDYQHVWKQTVSDYRNIQKDPSLVASASQSGPDGQMSVSQASQSISDQIRALYKRIHELKAPDQYQYLQEDTYLFYLGQADDYMGYANALGSGDQTKIDNAADEINQFAGDEHHKIEGDIESLGRDASQFRDTWKDALLAPNAAPPLTPPTTPVATPKPKKPKHHRKK
jgi:hypothetical protein